MTKAIMLAMSIEGYPLLHNNLPFYKINHSTPQPTLLQKAPHATHALPTYITQIESLRAPEIKTLIHINTANLEQLKQLPTIGPKRAEAIIKYREQLPLQQFESIEQLLDVPGIHAKSFERIRAYIVL